ncbi:MAG: hypothetical protein LBV43_15730 [Prevotella sp.]|jgi:hypothetical protein|nr:hypothetical protein [Prevotella sp.]
MKKLSVLVIMLLAFTFNSYATGEYNVIWSLNNGRTFDDISEFVGMTPDQAESLRDISYSSAVKLHDAFVKNDKKEAEKALIFNLVNAKAILTPEQYKKYLQILNVTYKKQQEAPLFSPI